MSRVVESNPVFRRLAVDIFVTQAATVLYKTCAYHNSRVPTRCALVIRMYTYTYDRCTSVVCVYRDDPAGLCIKTPLIDDPIVIGIMRGAQKCNLIFTQVDTIV